MVNKVPPVGAADVVAPNGDAGVAPLEFAKLNPPGVDGCGRFGLPMAGEGG
jgi:hypothetical protein